MEWIWYGSDLSIRRRVGSWSQICDAEGFHNGRDRSMHNCTFHAVTSEKNVRVPRLYSLPDPLGANLLCKCPKRALFGHLAFVTGESQLSEISTNDKLWKCSKLNGLLEFREISWPREISTDLPTRVCKEISIFCDFDQNRNVAIYWSKCCLWVL